jgi:hypothetical protein
MSHLFSPMFPAVAKATFRVANGFVSASV